MRNILTVLAAPRRRTGFVFMRWSIGMCLLYEYLSLYPQRHYFWGGAFMAPDTKSVFQYGGTWFFELILAGSIVLSALFTIGAGGRLVAIGAYLALLSIQDSNQLILDGGDNMLRLVMFYLMFSSGAPRGVLSAVFHNFSMLAVVTQLCLLYFFTGFYKATGEMWQTGVAVYYTSRVHWFSWPGISDVIFSNEYAVVFATYGTVLFELSFPFLLLNRYTRWVAIAAGIVLHAGIALFMGLIAFSWTMLSPYFLLLTDNEYRAVAKVLRTVGERAVGMPETSRGDILLYDGDRVVCNRFVSFVLSRNATFRAASMQSETGRRILKEHGKDAGRMETMYVVAGYQSEAERCLERSAAVLFSMARLDSVPWRGVAFFLELLPAGLLDAAWRFVVVRGNFVRFGDGECGIEHGRRVLRNEKEGGDD